MRQMMKKSRPFAVAVLTVALCLTMVLTVIMAEKTPYVTISGAELRSAEDGSLQLLVTVSVGNIPDPYMGNGLVAYLEYNPMYVTPSSMADNATIVGDMEDGSSSFQASSKLLYTNENGDLESPFSLEGKMEDMDGFPNTVILSESNIEMLLWNMKTIVTTSKESPVETDMISTFIDQEADYGDRTAHNLYIKANTDEPIALGQLSFRVTPNGQLDQVIEKLGDRKAVAGKNGQIEFGVNDFILKVGMMGMDPTLSYWTENPDPNVEYMLDAITEGINTEFTWEFDGEALLKAESTNKDVTINAYEAFGAGTPLDLLDALVRYSPTVRGTHVNGTLEDYAMHWGSGDDCIVYDKTTKEEYRIRRTKGVDNSYDGGYTIEQRQGNVWVTTNGDWYDPTYGEYKVTESFIYKNKDGKETAFPIEVSLTVTRVTVTGVTAEDLNKNYVKGGEPEPPKSLNGQLGEPGLELPSTAQLTTDVLPGQVSLTMPVVGWQTSAGEDVVSDLSNLTGTKENDASVSVNWNDDDNVGQYPLSAICDYNKSLEYNKTNIQSVYPWLTVNGTYPLSAARRILSSDDERAKTKYVVTSAASDDDGRLTINVAKLVEDAPADMATGTRFDVKLPGGEVIKDEWFTDGNRTGQQYTNETGSDVSDYDVRVKSDNAKGDTSTRTDGLELVRRSINLGGWFQVAVTEPGSTQSEYMPVYVPARNNFYTEPKYFDFTGSRAGLYPFYVGMEKPTTFVTLPIGLSGPGVSGSVTEDRYVPYQIDTTYDGATGAEPGVLNAFKVDSWPAGKSDNAVWSGSQWTVTQSPAFVKFGENGTPIFADYSYTGFGTVQNKDAHSVEMVVELQEEETPITEQLVTLTYEEQGDAVIPEQDDQLLRILFDRQQEGYVYRQNVTLTLTNKGTETINGINIDNTGSTGHEGEFIIVRHPAQTLAPGASTTFTVTYVWNLEAESNGPKTHYAIEPEPLKIYSDQGLLKQFEATYTVTKDPVWKLLIVTDPADGSLGTAMPINGVTDAGTLDKNPAPWTYSAGEPVWVLATPEDGYGVKRVYYIDDDGNEQTLAEYTPKVTTDPDVLTLFEHMPNHDLTIYIVFDEPLSAKLRLLDLQDWSAATDNIIVANDNVGHQHPLMLHKTTQATTAGYNVIRDEDDYNYNNVAAWDELKDPDGAIRLTEDEYLVVIPADADRSQIRFELRPEILAENIRPVVKVEMSYQLGYKPYEYPEKDSDPILLRHATPVFASPEPGKQLTATITISAIEPETGIEVEQKYKLIIAREKDPDESYPLSPGNSPYGMIMWDQGIASIDKAAAKSDFITENRFSQDSANTPAVVKADNLFRTYWTEAWPSGTNYDRVDEALFVVMGEEFHDYGPVQGEVTNNAGDVVDAQSIRRSLTVTLLGENDNYMSQQEQFANPIGTVTLDLGTTDTYEIDAAVWRDADNNVYKVRPDVYNLEYTYVDYDGVTEVTFTRPLIVLSKVGDVDLDEGRSANEVDADLLEQRVSKPLGYEHESDSYSRGPLFALRVCDANNDRNINNIDANTIRGAKDEADALAMPFYTPVDYGVWTTGTETP